MAREFLSTYLNDHLAGAQAALEILPLLRSLDGATLWEQIEAEIVEDRKELEILIQRAGSAPSRLRRAAAWTAEKLAELKMRVDDPSNGALKRFELVEALAIGIDGKRALWTALQRISEGSPELLSLDYPHLIARAERQRRLVEDARLNAAVSALCPPNR